MVDSRCYVSGNKMKEITLSLPNYHLRSLWLMITYSMCLKPTHLSEALCIAKLGLLLYKLWLCCPSPILEWKYHMWVSIFLSTVPATVSLYSWHIHFVYVTFHWQLWPQREREVFQQYWAVSCQRCHLCWMSTMPMFYLLTVHSVIDVDFCSDLRCKKKKSRHWKYDFTQCMNVLSTCSR